MRTVENREIATDALTRLVTALRKCGVEKVGALSVTFPRVQRVCEIARYHPMSQFRGRAKILVDVETARERLDLRESTDLAVLRIEVYRAVSLAYGTALLEATALLLAKGAAPQIPRWQFTQDDHPASFTQDFADFMSGGLFCKTDFWIPFLRAYGRMLPLYETDSDFRETAHANACLF